MVGAYFHLKVTSYSFCILVIAAVPMPNYEKYCWDKWFTFFKGFEEK